MRYLMFTISIFAGSMSQAQSCELCDDLYLTLQTHVAAQPSMPSAAMSVYSPDSGITTDRAVGTLSRDGSEALSVQHPFRIASVTKPFVAATILRLHEQGHLEVGDAIGRYLPDELVALLASGGYDPGQITVSHLLTHTSGLFDVFSTQPFADYFAPIAEGGEQKLFTLQEQVRLAVEHGEPYGAPGERYHYSDTGYILLGAIIERQTGKNMARAVRDLLGLDRLGLSSTWWEVFEPPPAAVLPQVHQYMGEMDTLVIQPTFDLYGGGGIVSTTEDLSRFFYHLLSGRLFDDPQTLALMLTVPAVSQAHPQVREPPFDGITSVYAHGISIHSYGNARVYAHGGFWGVLAGYAPDSDTGFSVSFAQQELADQPMQEVLLKVLSQASESRKQR